MPSGWALAIRQAQALAARRDYGLPHGDTAAFWRWAARQQGAGPTRTGLEPLAAAEAILWAALRQWEAEDGCNG